MVWVHATPVPYEEICSEARLRLSEPEMMPRPGREQGSVVLLYEVNSATRTEEAVLPVQMRPPPPFSKRSAYIVIHTFGPLPEKTVLPETGIGDMEQLKKTCERAVCSGQVQPESTRKVFASGRGFNIYLWTGKGVQKGVAFAANFHSIELKKLLMSSESPHMCLHNGPNIVPYTADPSEAPPSKSRMAAAVKRMHVWAEVEAYERKQPVPGNPPVGSPLPVAPQGDALELAIQQGPLSAPAPGGSQGPPRKRGFDFKDDLPLLDLPELPNPTSPTTRFPTTSSSSPHLARPGAPSRRVIGKSDCVPRTIFRSTSNSPAPIITSPHKEGLLDDKFERGPITIRANFEGSIREELNRQISLDDNMQKVVHDENGPLTSPSLTVTPVAKSSAGPSVQPPHHPTAAAPSRSPSKMLTAIRKTVRSLSSDKNRARPSSVAPPFPSPKSPPRRNPVVAKPRRSPLRRLSQKYGEMSVSMSGGNSANKSANKSTSKSTSQGLKPLAKVPIKGHDFYNDVDDEAGNEDGSIHVGTKLDFGLEAAKGVPGLGLGAAPVAPEAEREPEEASPPVRGVPRIAKRNTVAAIPKISKMPPSFSASTPGLNMGALRSGANIVREDGYISEKDVRAQTRIDLEIAMKRCDEIIPGLFLGGDGIARNNSELKRRQVTHILNVGGDQCECYHPGEFEYMVCDMPDKTRTDIEPIFYDVISFISSVVGEGPNDKPKSAIFVHCYQGVSRSVTCVIVYLMISRGLTFDSALKVVHDKRHVAKPNFGFTVQATMFGNRITSGITAPGRLYKIAPLIPSDQSYLVAHCVAGAGKTQTISSSLLQTDGVFVMHTMMDMDGDGKKDVYIWLGLQSSERSAEQGRRHSERLLEHEHAGIVIEVMQGQEDDAFWSFFRRRGECIRSGQGYGNKSDRTPMCRSRDGEVDHRTRGGSGSRWCRRQRVSQGGDAVARVRRGNRDV